MSADLWQRRSAMLRLMILVSCLFFLVSCSDIPLLSGGISERQAIERALEIATTSQPELNAPFEPPRNLRAEKLMLAEALRRLNAERGTRADVPVWLVTMEGKWEGACAPVVDGTPVCSHYSFYAVILDAATGEQAGTIVR